MPIRLFDDNGNYTADGDALDMEVSRFLRGIYTRDYNTRDASALIVHASVGEACHARLTQGARRRAQQAQPEPVAQEEAIEVRDE
jgi:hypothetical protein